MAVKLTSQNNNRRNSVAVKVFPRLIFALALALCCVLIIPSSLKRITPSDSLDSLSFLVPTESINRFVKMQSVKNMPNAKGNSIIASEDNIIKQMQNVNLTNLPSWMIEYIDWHASEIESLNPSNWDAKRYLVLRCIHQDGECGGTADRLQPVPFFLRLAYLSRRIFFIQWNRPCRLEEFLTPNILNWSLTGWLESHFQDRGPMVASVQRLIPYTLENPNQVVINGMLRSHDGGTLGFAKLFSDFNETAPEYTAFYGDMFRMLFQPSPPVAKLVEYQMRKNNLFPGNYSTAQYRAYYSYERDKSQLSLSEIVSHTQHAIRCAHNLLPDHTIFFSSDSILAESLAAEYGESQKYSVAFQRSHNMSKEPLHLDNDSMGAEMPPPEAFYDVFVDLWLMGNAKCVAHGVGGFGRWARLLSYDPQCASKHSYGRQLYDCS